MRRVRTDGRGYIAVKYDGKEKMAYKKVRELTEEEKELIENYLKGFLLCRRMLSLKRYEDEYFDTAEWNCESPAEFTVVKAKMYEVRHFIMDMPNSTEKLLLYYHYVRNDPVERCAELLGMSRSSAFRLKRRALSLAYEHSIRKNKDLTVGF